MRKRDVMGWAGLLWATTIAAAAAAPPVAAPAPVEGVWVRHERSFAYMGTTSHYSCDGLEGKLKSLLKLAGARDDAKVFSSCSEPRGGPSRIATARLTFHTLALPGSAEATGSGAGQNLGHPAKELKVEAPTPGLGQWKSVDLRGASNRNDIQEGDCELVEQFDRELLADFTVRNHESRFSCVPHQISLNGIQSRFEVLAPLPKPPAASGTPAQAGDG